MLYEVITDDDLDDYMEIREIKTNAFNPDSDNDGIFDGIEYYEYDTNPLSNDTDNDGMDDMFEINSIV